MTMGIVSAYCEIVDWIYLLQDVDHLPAILNTFI